MSIQVHVQTFEVKGGIMARVPEIRVVGFGRTEREARLSLGETMSAWCSSLARRGVLDAVLDRAGVSLVDDGKGIAIELR